jgi:hypothetical protein
VSLSSNAAVVEVPVEILDAPPRWSYGSLAANFARVQILVAWYGGDPDRYMEAVAQGVEDVEDMEFLRQIKTRLNVDPSLLADMRRIVSEFATRFPST